MAIWKTFADKLKNAGNKWTQGISNIFSDEPITDEFWEKLEEQLIVGDVGLELTEHFIASLRQVSVDRRIANASELKGAFAELLIGHLKKIPGMGKPMNLEKKPSVVILIGVNGSGKTTTAGKLAAQLQVEGKKVILAAADTFRAAAIEQLKAWGERSGVRVVAQAQDSDPAAVIFDALTAAKASGADVVIADTAGRLHTKSNLMEELGKVGRVVAREAPGGASEVFIVLDAVTGQNSFIQAETFSKVMPVTGVILTKFDSTSKGGIVLAVAEKLKMPIRYVGLGEEIGDIQLFDPEAFVKALLGLEE